MIFVTVGTDLPFDRLMRVVDQWAKDSGRGDVFAQIGHGGWVPTYISWVEMLGPIEFNGMLAEASVIIAHAGMGTILSALHHRKPILVMPKKASLGEQRNEHQIATSRYMMNLGMVTVAFDEAELRSRLGKIDELAPCRPIGATASQDLVRGISDFIHSPTGAK
jgi:UDP-N-acetylglucosamine transferase subunit ALG13